jgi:hypothetical protein
MTIDDVKKLTCFNVSKNHTDRWGVIFGTHTITYSFMHEDKDEVYKWILENYESFFKKPD